MKFGEYIKDKRLEKGISLRELASRVGISPSYMSDIEKGRRNAPNKEKVDKIAEVLFYSEEEINKLYDLAGESKNYIASDLSSYVMESSNIKYFLRTTKNKNDDNLIDDINYVLNNENIQLIIRAIREGNYTQEELKFLLKLIKK
ncbi:helix-turn-helix domain-containing protein [uncultured Clostridium sp.]|uniref:helix-turn-helix domain-containing protein n=1 Tax=uncultured Clostridium sp. TaxID=59620 RepID=UPI00272CEA21|nr:helix-turn-helix transcriptional regulator [uncultured Clostridium sp.]